MTKMRSWLPIPLAAVCLAGCAIPLAGCATLTRYNVRAEREYANEIPEAPVVLDRLNDCEAILWLTNAILASTPYAPGDPWIREIGLDNDEGSALKERLGAAPPYEKGEHEVPVAKLYRVHLEAILARARATRGAKAAEHASILDAIATLSPGAASIKAEWAAFEKAQIARMEAAQAKSEARVSTAEEDIDKARSALQASLEAIGKADIDAPASKISASDALTVVSVALRANLEAVALLSTVVSQATHANQIAERDIWIVNGENPPVPLSGLPPRAEAMEQRAAGEVSAAQAMADSLTELTGKSITKTAGWQLQESIVDQVVGVQLDSIRMRLRGDGEIVFFNQIGLKDAAIDGYRGYTRRLAYDADPLLFIGSRLIVTFDWLHVKNAARLNAGFKTDRLWSTNGTIEEVGDLGPQLGLSGFASDIFDVGLDLIGIRTQVKVSKFTSGTVREIAVNPVSGADMYTVDSAPLQLSAKLLDIGYDISFLMPQTAARYWIEDLIVGFRYLGYTLPRILYELEDSDPSPDGTRLSFSRQSPAQPLNTEYYMGGLAARFGQGDVRIVSLFGDVGLYAGSGPASFYFLKDPKGDLSAQNRDERSQPVVVFNGSAGLGVRFRLTPRKMRLRFLAEFQYHADFIGQTIISSISETTTKEGTTYAIGKTVDFGGIDVYHGPHARFVGIF